jgi:hypothetical protein
LRGRGSGESLDGFDASDARRDEVVEVVGRENGTHSAGCFGEILYEVEEEALVGSVRACRW